MDIKNLISAWFVLVTLGAWIGVPEAQAQAKRNGTNVPVLVESSSDVVASSARSLGLHSYEFTFKQLGVTQPIMLRGIDPQYPIYFRIPSDEVVVGLKLRLVFSYSPSLLTNLSHLKVLLNGEVVQTIPLPKESAGSSLIREVNLDPRFLSDYNQLSLQFIGHYTLDCEDPFHSSLWLHISNSSVLQFVVSPVSMTPDLGFLPAPFFDQRDGARLERPFVFGESPSVGVLEAASIVASWFGDLAGYRGAVFPVHLNRIPDSHAILFVTNEDRFQGLVNLPPISGPMISVIPHPTSSRFKLLLVMGRDANELRVAATSLALGKAAFSGQTVAINKYDNPKPRVPYDAPRWLASHRPVKFGEIASPQELNVRGLSPDLVRLNLMAPPDLFGWNSDGVPVHLRFRYTPRPKQDKSTLNVLINDKFVSSYPLRAYTGSNVADSVFKRLAEFSRLNDLFPDEADFHLPVIHLRSRSQLQFHFSFDYPKEGSCKDVMLDNVRAAIDPESVIDLSGFPHYIRMPDMSAFANSGFPFTRMADLSETAVVLPDEYGAEDISTFLALMGRMGYSTGLPVYGVSVGRAAEVSRFADKDILLIGGPSKQRLFREWAAYMPFSSEGAARYFSLSELRKRFIPWFESPDAVSLPTGKLTATTLARDAVLFGFRSPLNGDRSVVAVTSDRAGGQFDIVMAILDNDVVPKIQGAMVVVRGKDVDAMDTEDSYYIGSLPLLTAIRWTLANNVWLSALLMVVFAILAGGVFYTVLRRRAAQRLSGKK